MKSKNAIPSKIGCMKEFSGNFILNEKIGSEIVHEKNVGKVNDDFYKLSKVNENSATAKSSTTTGSSQIIKTSSIKAETNENLVTEEKVIDRIVTESRTDYSGKSPKRYTTRCYMKLQPVPVWYSESILLHINSTKRRYEEKVYFKNKLHPQYWSEHMITEVPPKSVVSVAV